MSVFMVIDRVLETSDFGVQLKELFTLEKDKLVGAQVCFARVQHDRSLEWFKLDESIEEVAPSTAPAIAFQHLMLIRTEEEVQKLFRDQTFDAWAESTRESRPHSKCILIVYGSGKLRKNFSTHNQMTVTQLKNDLQILFIDDLAKCVSFIFYFTKALAKEKLFDDEFVSNAKSVKVNAQHQVGLQKLWEAQLKILKSVNGIMAKAAVTESAAEFRAKSLDNASSNSNNPRTLPVVLAKVLSSTNGAENCIN